MSDHEALIAELRGWTEQPGMSDDVIRKVWLMHKAADAVDRLRTAETAPKDGEWFLARQDGEVYPCEWVEEEQDEGPPREGWFDLFNQSFEAPTEWQPRPGAGS